MKKHMFFAIALGVGVIGCGDDGGSGTADALVVSADAMTGSADAALVDAATIDAATADAATIDAGVVDAMPSADAATIDAAPTPDGMVPDAAVPDAAVPDATIPDAMTPDAMVSTGCVLDSPLSLTNSTTIGVADPGTTTTTITVSGAGSELYSVRVSTMLQHVAPSDLTLTLISPAGTRVLMSGRNGGSFSNVFNGTAWSDTGSERATNFNAYAEGVPSPSLIPESAFTVFRGENPNGTWTLELTDAEAGFAGTLNNWGLEVTTVNGTPVKSTTTHSSTNVVGISMATSPAVDSIVVSGFSGTICDVDVTTNVTHTWSSDLTLTLQSPSGTNIVLTARNGDEWDDVFNGTLFNDAVNAPATTATYVDGVTTTPLTPEGAMGQVEGENANGTWQLSVDDAFSSDNGQLTGWSLQLSSCTCTP